MTDVMPADPVGAGPGSLHQLIYFSRQMFAPTVDFDFEIGRIIQTSIRNNRDLSVTGLLLIHSRWFVQVLEGSARAVRAVYHRIAEDPRHEAATVIAAGPAEQREFAAWNMCARRMNPSDDVILDALEQRGEFEPWRLDKTTALQLLIGVRDSQGL